MSTHVIVHANAQLLTEAVAARLITRIIDAQSARGRASIVLTGGGVGVASLAAVAANPARDAIDWSNVHMWWGDERFVPANNPERNEQQARNALLNSVAIPPDNVHPMPSSDGPDGVNAEAAATRYAAELARWAKPGQDLPAFDVLMLGVGPDGHVASIFPESPAVYDERPVTSVHSSPKPPSTRITLTFPTIRSADEVWLLAAGEAKAPAIGLALAGAGSKQIPAVGAFGGVRTCWLLDRAAAARIPEELRTAY